MENNRRVVVTLALVAVIAVAAIGIGYAYTASTSNSGNTVTPGYMATTLKASSDNSTPAYTDVFEGTVKYNTEVSYEYSKEYITFTFDELQLDRDTDGIAGNDAVKVGEGVYLNIEYVNGVTEAFKVIMNDVRGVSGDSGMSALYSYVVGYKFGTNKETADACTEQFVTYNPGSGAILANGNDSFTGGDTSGIKVILINLYVQGMTGAQKVEKSEAASALIKPLNEVTFKFTAASTTTLTNLKFSVNCNEPSNGTIGVTPAATDIAPGTNTTITLTPSEGYHVATFTINGVDYMSRLPSIGTKDVSVNVCENIAVVATFEADSP